MSRGGRGGFRGGGGGQQSGAMQLVSFDMLKDLGSMFNVQTALFPEMDVPMARKPNNSESNQWKLKDECIELIQASPFYLVPPPPPPDIERYSDRYKKRKAKQSLRDIRSDMDYFPEELHSILDPNKKKKRKMANGSGDAFEQLKAFIDMEGKEGDGKDDDDEDGEKKEGDNPEEDYGDDYEDEEDLVDDNDYAQNYFDNGEGDDIDDDDGDGGDFF
ncbi:DNA-directed RNA polymerase III, subunit Rpc31 [Circinella umbellata]|nr:DNA-directed RNA polymerase III, subunit Rpc31 [Circinella umbellata]